jgi:transglutaminase-like putative cysteine protease
MKIRLGYDIAFETPREVAVVALLHVHPTRVPDLLEPDVLHTNDGVARDEYVDSFGNRCTRLVVPAGELELRASTLIQDSGLPDQAGTNAVEHPVAELPTETLQFLLASRYCEVDLLSPIAHDLFGGIAPGWPRVQAICDFVHNHIAFGYEHARATMTAWEVYNEGKGVCRDYAHLAIAFCRCMNIPARYCTGYLGDIGMPKPWAAGDFAGWFEAYIGGRWYTFDARNNIPRIGRVLIAQGRDASDVPITQTFGPNTLVSFTVWTDEVPEAEQLKA